MVGSNATGATLFVGENHAIGQRVKIELFAQHGKEFNSGIVCPGYGGFGGCRIRTGESGPARILDTVGSHISIPIWVLLAPAPQCQPRRFQGRVW